MSYRDHEFEDEATKLTVLFFGLVVWIATYFMIRPIFTLILYLMGFFAALFGMVFIFVAVRYVIRKIIVFCVYGSEPYPDKDNWIR